MSEAPTPLAEPTKPAPAARESQRAPTRIVLVSYPKIVFLYPILVTAMAVAIYLNIVGPQPGEPTGAIIATVIFLGVMAANLVVLAFDFPRTTSLTLFFLLVAVVLGVALLAMWKPDLLPVVRDTLVKFHPLANASFYWGLAAILAVILVAAVISRRFDYWEVRPNELLHHHGFLANLERFPAPNLRIDTEICDVFEYVLLHSGRLVLQVSNERRAIILDSVPFIKRKERAITRMLSALRVQVHNEHEGESLHT